MRTWREGWNDRIAATEDADAVDRDIDALINAVSAVPPGMVRRPQVAPREIPFDVVSGTAETPVGFLSLALTPRGLVSCSFDSEDTVLPRLARAVSPRIGPHDAWLEPVRQELNAYFEGRLTAFTVPLDLRLTSDFGRVVLRSLLDVPYGSTTFHTDLAARIGRASATRAVANTLATNPLCLFLPCHRVVPPDYPGECGPYTGGTAAKQYLLRLERERRSPKTPAF
ncbi:methylated-DNA--[protein]-cysteine S-methyltransferase [Nocardiopsis ansamitocini]|uniref:Methylated-DNA--[protein]-cysteine S-methyltransferase n=1 Tax=Nocardiopsis ansamitocini TaxID=1670832 RepID=A0A9W6PAB2_9ACTN|nr:methylated-DNA--[protein]-cysteine S-methyltransferase [Nocardiopsis ansamitocini]GLU49867.1 hypothetical protein Nans01_42180 [Nocardiopsis ansamitocini]